MAKGLSSLSDAELLAVAAQTIDAMTANPAAYGTTVAAIGDLSSDMNDASTAVSDQQAKLAAAKASTLTKEEKITALIDRLRQMRDIAKAHGASDALMESTTIPHGGSAPVPPSATTPIATVDTSQRLKHTISWAESTTPDNKRRPRGAMGVEIWRKIDGAPPVDVSECTFVAIDSASPHTVDYSGADAGKMVHYMLRWKMRDGATLAFGETVSATVTG